MKFDKPKKYGGIPIVNTNLDYQGLIRDIVAKVTSKEFYSNNLDNTLVIEISERIFLGLTGERLDDFVRVEFLEESTFNNFFRNTLLLQEMPLEEVRKRVNRIHGSNIGYVAAIRNKGFPSTRFYSLAHELGHIIYPDSTFTEKGELGAFFFQELALKKLAIESKKNARVELRGNTNENSLRIRELARNMIREGKTPLELYNYSYSGYPAAYFNQQLDIPFHSSNQDDISNFWMNVMS